MPNEERINKLTTIFQELGNDINKGSARIVPNNEVLDDSPSDLPAGYIKVKDELGYTIPAVTVANIIVVTGQFVNLLYIEGTEPIAFQQGSDGTTNIALWQLEGGTGPDIYYDNGKVGIGTNVIPHGSIGWAQLALDGADFDIDGPHIQMTTDADDYPVVQILPWGHDEMAISFDSYYDGAWRSSSNTGNFQIYVTAGRFYVRYDDNIAAGSVVTWNTGIALRADSGAVGIGTFSPRAQLEVIKTTKQLALTHTANSIYTEFTVDANHDMTIKPSSTGQIILQPTSDSIDFFQVQDADGGVPIFNVDSTNERIGIKTNAPEAEFHLVRDGSGTEFQLDKYGGAPGIIVRRASGTLATPTQVLSGQQIFGFGARPWFSNTAAFSAVSLGNFTFQAAQNLSSTAKGTKFSIGVTLIGNNSVTTRFHIAHNGDVSIGPNITSPLAQLHIDQSGAGATQPVLLLDQADVSEEMIEFVSTIGVGNAIEAVGAKALTTTHFIKVTLPGSLTRYIEVGTIA